MDVCFHASEFSLMVFYQCVYRKILIFCLLFTQLTNGFTIKSLEFGTHAIYQLLQRFGN